MSEGARTVESGPVAGLWLSIAKWIDEYVVTNVTHTKENRTFRLSSLSETVSSDPDSGFELHPFISSAIDAYRMILVHNPHAECLSSSLRFLDLVVNEGGSRCIGEEYVDPIPAHTWVPIVRQIFCRLSHPSEKVSRIVTRLLHLAASVSPESVLYLSTRGTESTSHLIQMRSRTILHHIRTHYPELTDECDVLFGELIKLSELWDEQWLLLIQRYRDFLFCVTLDSFFERDYSRLTPIVTQRLSLIKEFSDLHGVTLDEICSLYSVAVMPIVSLLNSLCVTTTCRADVSLSLHEVSFLRRFKEAIHLAIVDFADEQNVRHGVSHKWDTFLQIEKDLKSFMRHKLRLSDVCPSLLSFRSHALSIPGTSDSLSPLPPPSSPSSPSPSPSLSFSPHTLPLTIQGISPIVNVIPTKTKPKKMVFQGRNGDLYSFLLKGREDLRLDERIAHFLRLLPMISHGRSNAPIQSYSVLPLNSRCGVIQWVAGAVPLFTVYKKWQRSEKMGHIAVQGTHTKTPGSWGYLGELEGGLGHFGQIFLALRIFFDLLSPSRSFGCL